MKNNPFPVVELSTKVHRNKDRLLVNFKYDEAIIEALRPIEGATWSRTLQAWHLPNTAANLEKIKSKLQSLAIINTDVHFGMSKTSAENSGRKIICDEKRALLKRYRRYLRGKMYSYSTISTYLSFMGSFVEYYNDHDLATLTERQVELFIENVMLPKNYSASTHRQFISGLRLFLKFYPIEGINKVKLEMPKKDRRLPTVISHLEVLDILRCTPNLKHRTILALIYSCGLRVGELLNLKLTDINLDRKQLFIKNGKGRKDRYVNMADSFVPLLKNYYTTYLPEVYLFNGKKGLRYSAESIRAFLKRSCKRAKLTKHITPHTLRHSYATHLLESGIDIRYIQELLGHSKPETTMLYTHVSTRKLQAITNPLDMALSTHGNSVLPLTDPFKHQALKIENQ